MSLPTPTLPSGSAFSISSSNFSVDLPNTIDSAEESIEGTPYHNEITGRDGYFRTRDSIFLGRVVYLSGPILDSSLVDDIRRVSGEKRVTVTRDSRTISGDVTLFRLKEEVTSHLWRFELEIQSDTPYWEGSNSTTDDSPTSVTNDGDVLVYPIFTITVGSNGLASINLTVDGREVEWTGNASDGDVIIIDCSQLLATINSGTGAENTLNEMNDSFFVDPIRLKPGDNTISPTINGSATYEVSFTERYL